MNLCLTANEYRYRKVISSVGIAMLIFLILINLLGVFLLPLQMILSQCGLSAAMAEIIYELIYAAVYLLSFMLPVAVLKGLIRKSGYPYRPMRSAPRLSPLLIPIIFGGMVLIWAQSYINASLVNIFDYSAFSSAVLWGESSSVKNYQIVLQFITMCLVPAFCEEFLFRGAILTNCLPFGRGNAILISALLFGLMHQNAEQILYAFAAGIFLGVVYERTGSIWNCTFLHLINNFSSLVIQISADRFGGLHSELMYVALEAMITLIGIACIAWLIVSMSPRKQLFREGVFGRTVPAADDYAECPILPKRAFRLFFSFPMVLFLVICILTILSLIGIAVLFNGYIY